MNPFICRTICLTIAFLALFHLWGPAGGDCAQERFPNAVKIVAPDGLSTKVLARPSEGSEVLAIALHDDILEYIAPSGNYIQLRLPGSKVTGYVLAAHTRPWTPPKQTVSSMVIPAVIAALVIMGALAAFVVIKIKKTRDLERRAAFMARSIRDAEELFRARDYTGAISEFKTYLQLQDGEVRNPDVYRRLSVCYLRTQQVDEAAKCWDKMNELGGAKNTDDYTLGVEIMTAQGKHADAAQIYEKILEIESDEDKVYDIRCNLIDLYRRLKQPREFLKHALELMPDGLSDKDVLQDTVNFLMARNETDLALEANHRELITRICHEFLEEKALTPEAERIYLKYLEYDRTDARIHRILAEKYKEQGDVRKAVGELTILHQIDKEKSDDYVEEAARLYVENGRVADALKEGNPKIIRKIAQTFLARSEVTPDAVAVYEKVLEFQPQAVQIHRLLSTVYLTRGDLAKYKAELHLLHEIDGENHDYLTDLAKCVIDNDLIDQTMREGNRALNTKILKQLIKRKAHDDTAVALFERLSRLEPDNAILRGALAKAYELRGQPDKELEHLLVLSALKPDIEEIAKRTASLAIQNNLLEPVLLTAQGKVLSLVAREIANRKLEGPICSRIVEKAAKESQKDQLIEEPMAATPKAPEPAPPLPMEPPPSRVAPSETPPASVTQRVRQAAAEKRAKTTGTIKVKISPASAEKKMEAPLGKAPYPISAPEPGAQEAPLVLQKGAPEIAPVEPSIDVTEPKASPRVEPPVTTFVSAHSKEEPLIELGGQQMVQITVAHDAPSASVDPITTFVSGHAKGRAAVQYREEELYRPHAGGLAFTAVQGLARDGWGAWQTAAEINSGRDVLLRVFDKGLMKAVVLEDEVMEEFVQQISHLAATMAHKNVLEVEEVVTGPGRLRGLIYSYLPHTLEQVLSPGERPQLDSLLELIREIVDGLAYASNYKGLDGIYRKICHLNMQASQILVGDDLKTCKIAGFGYSEVFRKLIRAKGPRWQDPGMNPAYLPPEFFRAKEVGIDERAADVYSLGVLMHFIATGEPPFEGPAFDDYKFQHTKIIPAPTRLINPAVPDWLEEVILTSLEKDPEKRWSSVAEIQEVLKREMR